MGERGEEKKKEKERDSVSAAAQRNASAPNRFRRTPRRGDAVENGPKKIPTFDKTRPDLMPAALERDRGQRGLSTPNGIDGRRVEGSQGPGNATNREPVTRGKKVFLFSSNIFSAIAIPLSRCARA